MEAGAVQAGTGTGQAGGEHHEEEGLHRGLKNRHIQMIAIGGAIGVGLFLGSASAIDRAGPGLLFAYTIAGAMVFFIVRALGELLLYKPIAGSFSSYAEEFIGPWAGFATGWTYWFLWIVTGMAETTAAGIYMQYWFPSLPQWIPALVFLCLLLAINLVAVGLFGEFEFWFAIIKVVTIIGIIVIGLAVILFGLGPLGDTASFSNLYNQGGFFPEGFGATLLALQIVVFAFLGVELVGVTAGEAENPETTIPSAVNKIIARIAIFYIGALVVVMSLVAWNELSPDQSPFVTVFDRIGIPAAAGIINFVVLTAALSSCNSGIFSTGRMLLTLARRRHAPRKLGQISARGVPAVGLFVSFSLMLIGVILNYFVPEKAFAYVTSVATVNGIFTWVMILIAHLGYRRALAAGRVRESAFKMPGAPITNYIVLLFLAIVVVLIGLGEETRVALYVAPFWFGLVAAGYVFARSRGPRATGQAASQSA